jgi:pseudoazurin
MLPADAMPFLGKSGEDIAVTFEKPGIYGVKCLPHYATGMVAMVVVGRPANLDEAKAVLQLGKAKQVTAGLFDRLAAQTAQK